MNYKDTDIFGYQNGGEVLDPNQPPEYLGMVPTPMGMVRMPQPNLTPAQATNVAGSFLPGAGLAEAFGEYPQFPDSEKTLAEMLEGQRELSLAENYGEGNYFTAGLQGLGVAGDAVSAGIPIVGPLVGGVLKAPRAMQKYMKILGESNEMLARQALRLEISPNPALGKNYYGLDDSTKASLEARGMTPDEIAELGDTLETLEEQKKKATLAGYNPNYDLNHGNRSSLDYIDPDKLSADSYAGKGVYKSTEFDDSYHNYANLSGPDIQNRINSNTDQIASEMKEMGGGELDRFLREEEGVFRNLLMDKDRSQAVLPNFDEKRINRILSLYETSKGMDAEFKPDFLTGRGPAFFENADGKLVPQYKLPNPTANDTIEDIAYVLASAEQSGNSNVYKLWAKTNKHAIIGDAKNATKIEGDEGWVETLDDLQQSVQEAQTIGNEQLLDSLQDELFMHMQDYGSPTEKIMEALNNNGLTADGQARISTALMDAEPDEFTTDFINNLIQDMAEGDYIDYNYYPETRFPVGEFRRGVFEDLGYEGIIDKNPQRFRMDNVYDDTEHVITFPNFRKNVRSVEANFDPAMADRPELYMKDGGEVERPGIAFSPYGVQSGSHIPYAEPEGLPLTEAQTAMLGASFAPGYATLESAGGGLQFPSADMSVEDMLNAPKAPSLPELLESGKYFDASLQGLGVVGDMASAIPIVGTALGSVAKFPHTANKMVKVMKMIGAATPEEAIRRLDTLKVDELLELEKKAKLDPDIGEVVLDNLPNLEGVPNVYKDIKKYIKLNSPLKMRTLNLMEKHYVDTPEELARKLKAMLKQEPLSPNLKKELTEELLDIEYANKYRLGSADNAGIPNYIDDGADAVGKARIVSSPARKAARNLNVDPVNPNTVPEVGNIIFTPLIKEADGVAKVRQVESSLKAAQIDVATVDDLIMRATSANPEFQATVKNIANSVGADKANPIVKLKDGTDLPIELKTRKAIEKKLDRRQLSPDNITDSLRTSVYVDSADQGDNIVNMLSESYPLLDRGFQIMPTGYFDRTLNIIVPSRHGPVIAELQILNKPMAAAKPQGHRLYNVERELIRRFGGQKNIPNTHIKRFEGVREKSLEIYGDAKRNSDLAIIENMIEKFKNGGAVNSGNSGNIFS